MTQKMEKQLRELAERFDGDFAFELTPEAFNLIITALMKSKTLSETDKSTLVKQFSTELISVDCIIDKIL